MNQETSYEHTVSLLASVLLRLQEALAADPKLHNTVVDGTIRRFKFSIELFWKALKKKLLRDYGVDAQGPRVVLQQAYVNKIIHNEAIWLAMLNDRNLTSHTYNLDLAQQVYQNVQKYGPFLQQEFDRIFKDK